MKKLLLLAALFTGVLPLAAGDPTFITHPGASESSISPDDARSILLGNKTKWGSGGTIRLVVLTTGEVHEQVMKVYAQRTADAFQKIWVRRVFTGNGTMPMQAKSDAEVIAFVAATPGAFGYVDKQNVTDKVRVLALP